MAVGNFKSRLLQVHQLGICQRDSTVGSIPFEVLGVDVASPIAYKLKAKKEGKKPIREGKAYILLFACSLTRAIHLELLPNQTTEEFIKSLKRFIARRGRPRKIYSDNGKTFTAAAKWLGKVMKAELELPRPPRNKMAIQLKPCTLVGWAI